MLVHQKKADTIAAKYPKDQGCTVHYLDKPPLHSYRTTLLSPWIGWPPMTLIIYLRVRSRLGRSIHRYHLASCVKEQIVQSSPAMIGVAGSSRNPSAWIWMQLYYTIWLYDDNEDDIITSPFTIVVVIYYIRYISQKIQEWQCLINKKNIVWLPQRSTQSDTMYHQQQVFAKASGVNVHPWP